MNIDERSVKHGTVWSCQGQLTEAAGDEFSAAASRAARRGCRRILIDLNGVTMTDAAGLGLLVSVHRRTAITSTALCLVRVPRRLQQLLTITGLSEVFAIFDSVEQAVALDRTAQVNTPVCPFFPVPAQRQLKTLR